VTLLSRPLPESVPLPASAQSFFLEVFERATRNPHVETLRPVYCILNGTYRGLFSTLPAETRQDFDAKLTHILSSTTTAQNSMLMMWCFGITILTEHPEAARASPALKWKTASGRKLFGSDMYKTITLAYLSVVLAAKGDVNIPDTEALEGIRIATQTLHFIDARVRETWHTSRDSAKTIVAKLHTKILRSGINPAVQLEALCFYALIAGKHNLHADLVKEYEAALPKVLGVVDSNSIREALSTSLPLFAVRCLLDLENHTDAKQPQIQERSIRALLSKILRTSISPTSTHEVANTQAMVNELTTVLPDCPHLRSNIVTSLSSNDMQETVQSFLRVDVEGPHGGTQSCKPYVVAMCRALVSATISMCLMTTLSFGSTALALPNALGMALINKQQQLPFIPDRCDHSSSSSSVHGVSLFQQECTPLSGVHLQDWRERLGSELENQSFYQRDTVIRSVAQICHDLESRCQTVEEPLRREKEKSSRLQEEVRELRENLASVELKRWEDGEHLAALDSENERLEKEKDQVTDELGRLRQDFDDAKLKAMETLREARDQYSTAEMQLRSSVLAREDDVRVREQEIHKLHSTVVTREEEIGTLRSTVQAREYDIRACEQEIAELRQAKDTLSDKCDESCEALRVLNDGHDDLRAQMADISQLLERESEETAALTGEVNELKTGNAGLVARLRDTMSELANVTGRLEDLQVRHQELAQSSTDALENLKKQFETEMGAAASKAAEEHSRLNDNLQDALRNGREVSEAYEELQRETEELQTTVPPLQSKVEELTNACLGQDEELQRLRAWKNRVMASMGLPPEPMQRAAPRSTNNESHDPRTPRQHRRRKSALQTQEGARKAPAATQTISSAVMENVANASFTSSDSHSSQSGSTPKRAKPQTSFKVPTMRTAYSSKALIVPKSVSKKLSPAKRSALRPISPNRRHTSVGFTIPENEEEPERGQNVPLRKTLGSLQNANQADFDMDEFVGGTPFTPGAFTSGTGRIPDEDGSITEL